MSVLLEAGGGFNCPRIEGYEPIDFGGDAVRQLESSICLRRAMRAGLICLCISASIGAAAGTAAVARSLRLGFESDPVLVLGTHASRAHWPNSRSVRQASATPASGSTQRKPPLPPK